MQKTVGWVKNALTTHALQLLALLKGHGRSGRGYARALLNAFVIEACNRGVRRIWVASYDFQAPGMYEKAGFKRIAEFKDWPQGHINVLLCKTLSEQGARND